MSLRLSPQKNEYNSKMNTISPIILKNTFTFGVLSCFSREKYVFVNNFFVYCTDLASNSTICLLGPSRQPFPSLRDPFVSSCRSCRRAAKVSARIPWLGCGETFCSRFRVCIFFITKKNSVRKKNESGTELTQIN